MQYLLPMCTVFIGMGVPGSGLYVSQVSKKRLLLLAAHLAGPLLARIFSLLFCLLEWIPFTGETFVNGLYSGVWLGTFQLSVSLIPLPPSDFFWVCMLIVPKDLKIKIESMIDSKLKDCAIFLLNCCVMWLFMGLVTDFMSCFLGSYMEPRAFAGAKCGLL